MRATRSLFESIASDPAPPQPARGVDLRRGRWTSRARPGARSRARCEELIAAPCACPRPAGELEQPPIFQAQRRQTPPPQTAGIQSEQIRPRTRPSADQCPKMTGVSRLRRAGTSNQGRRPAGSSALCPCIADPCAVPRADAQAGHRVDNDTQTIEAGQLFAPAGRLVAVHRASKKLVAGAPAAPPPLRAASSSARVTLQSGSRPACTMASRPRNASEGGCRSQSSRRFSIGCCRISSSVSSLRSLAGPPRPRAGADRDCRAPPPPDPKRLDEAQRGERIGTAVDQVADKPQAIAR